MKLKNKISKYDLVSVVGVVITAMASFLIILFMKYVNASIVTMFMLILSVGLTISLILYLLMSEFLDPDNLNEMYEFCVDRCAGRIEGEKGKK